MSKTAEGRLALILSFFYSLPLRGKSLSDKVFGLSVIERKIQNQESTLYIGLMLDLLAYM